MVKLAALDSESLHMDFEIPQDIAAFLEEVDRFIDDKIRPLEETDDNIRFFDHRREDARCRD